MSQADGPSSVGLLALLIGAVVSIATTCGPPDPVPPFIFDTGGGGGGGGGGGVEEEVGYTLGDDGAFTLRAEGDTVVRTVRVSLNEDCLTEVPEYLWGYPSGWVILAAEVTNGLADGDTGGVDTGSGDTGADTAVDDSASGDTAADTASGDTSADTDTAADTASEDTAADTATDDTAVDTGPAPDARFRVAIVDQDGIVVLDDAFRLDGEAPTRVDVSDLVPFLGCVRDTPCERTWEVAVTLTEGEAAHGTLDVHAHIELCSSGPGDASHIAVAVE
ncbi:MAG: hypothetical protein Q8P18_27225 [Pseudomonadota bacterium]|nr:hypothetical protein [Pseudomonadota bacterium]